MFYEFSFYFTRKAEPERRGRSTGRGELCVAGRPGPLSCGCRGGGGGIFQQVV